MARKLSTGTPAPASVPKAKATTPKAKSRGPGSQSRHGSHHHGSRRATLSVAEIRRGDEVGQEQRGGGWVWIPGWGWTWR
jgi:hypothetical protein